MFWNGVESEEFIALMDLSDGADLSRDGLAQIEYTITGSNTLDYINNNYIVNTNLGITVINLATGSVVKTYDRPDGYSAYKFHSATNSIYGLWQDNADGICYFASTDLGTGKTRVIRSIPGLEQYNISTSTLDYKKNRYIVACNLGIISIDIFTGQVVNIYQNEQGLFELEYDGLTGKVFGLFRRTDPGISFASLDLNTGGITPIDQLDGITFAYTGSATVDWDKRKYIFHSNRGVVSLDLGTGSFTTGHQANSTYNGLEYYNPEKAVHPALRSIAGDIRVYPVPAYSQLSVESVVPFNRIILYNDIGQLIMKYECENSVHAILDVRELATGAYFITVEYPHNQVSREVLIGNISGQ